MIRNKHARLLRVGAASACLLLVCATGCTKGSKSDATGSSSAQLQGAGPKIGFDTRMHDFGTATSGDTLEHVFKVTNTGNAPLVIKRVRSSCGCTAAEPKQKEIPPGGSTDIEVKFNTKGRNGLNQKTITVISNDPNEPQAKLEIKAMLEQLLAFDPYNLRMNISHGEEKTFDAWLTGKMADKAKLAIKETTGGDPLKVELAEVKEGDITKHGLRLKIKGDKIGSSYGKVTVTTGVEQLPEIDLRFSWTIEGNLTIRPRALFFDTRQVDADRIVRVTSKVNTFKLMSAKVTEGPFEASIEKPDAGEGYLVHVRTKKDMKPAEHEAVKGKLVLASNDPLEPKLEIPLTVRNVPGMIRRPNMPDLGKTPILRALPRPSK